MLGRVYKQVNAAEGLVYAAGRRTSARNGVDDSFRFFTKKRLRQEFYILFR